MKKILLLFSTLLFAINLSAQNYDNYLQKAYSALEEGKIEVAQSSYNIYKKMTGRTDLDFETLIKDAVKNDWSKLCYIVDLGNGEYLVAQKKVNCGLYFKDAKVYCQSSRLGGFVDWRLPSDDEAAILFANGFIPDEECSNSGFWCDSKSVFFISGEKISGKKSKRYSSTWGCFPIRRFKK